MSADHHYATIIHQRSTDVLSLTLNRTTKVNALDAVMVAELDHAISAITALNAHDATIEPANAAMTVTAPRLVVLRGAGRNFSAGFDFTEFESSSPGDLLLRFVAIEQLLQTLYRAPWATLALAQGKNFGAGADLFMTAQQRVCTPDATFRMPGLQFGLQLGTRRLAQRIGEANARRVLTTSMTVDADEALAIGMVSVIAAAAEWPTIIAAELNRARALSTTARARLNRALTTDTDAVDLADLVNSAAQPGLKDRIKAYRERT